MCNICLESIHTLWSDMDISAFTTSIIIMNICVYCIYNYRIMNMYKFHDSTVTLTTEWHVYADDKIIRIWCMMKKFFGPEMSLNFHRMHILKNMNKLQSSIVNFWVSNMLLAFDTVMCLYDNFCRFNFQISSHRHMCVERKHYNAFSGNN